MRSRILFTLCFISVLVGQPSFTEHAITTSTDYATSVHAVDIDGDGDMDVLSASHDSPPSTPGKIAWYENDGNENFTEHVISTSFIERFNSVYAVDVDGDGDMDVLSASYHDNAIEIKGFGEGVIYAQ